jgi:cobalt-zinc-cadmium efflux system outer membrane protein
VVERAERLASLASRSLVPNPTLGVLAEREDAAGNAQWGVSVALPLPFWNRNRGEVAARRADLGSAQYERAAARNEVGNEVTAAVEAYALAVEQHQLLEAAVIAPARENQRLLEISYREGKTGLPSILLLRNQLLEAELEYLDAWLTARTALATLEAAIGAPLNMDTDSDDR